MTIAEQNAKLVALLERWQALPRSDRAARRAARDEWRALLAELTR